MIERVNELAMKEKQPLVSTNFKYSWDKGGHRHVVDDHTLDYEEQEGDDSKSNEDDHPDIRLQDMNVTEVNDEHVPDDNDTITDNDEIAMEHEVSDNEDITQIVKYDIEVNNNENDTTIETIEESNNEEERSTHNNNEEVSINSPINLRRSGLRSGTRVNYSSLHKYGEKQLGQVHKKLMKKMHGKGCMRGKSGKQKNHIKIMAKDMMRKVVSIIMSQILKESRYAQVSVKEGIKRFGESATNAVLAEFGQLHDQHIFDPQYVRNLTDSQKKGALNLITLVKEKRCGKIKGRACADGRKQRRYIKKEDVASPTIQLESLLLSLLIDAFEKRDVATADVVGAYLMANMDDFVLVKLTGDSVDIMCKVDTNYNKYVHYENGKKVLYLKLLKALYGCMQSALLWYHTFKTKLEDMGFIINKYDPCVANSIIDGKQCTICWYVDDAKISHVDSKVVDKVICQLEDVFGKMTVTRGNQHTFVGMDFELNGDGSVAISMTSYIKEAIDVLEKNYL